MAREVDARDGEEPSPEVSTPRREELAAAADQVSRALPGEHELLIASFDDRSGNPAVVVSRDAPARQGDYVQRALAHLQDLAPVVGLAAQQPPEFQADPSYQTTSAGGVSVHLRQQYKGLPVYDAAQTVRFDPDGRLLEVAGRSVTVDSDPGVQPASTAVEALQAAVRHLAAGDAEAGTDPFGEPLSEPALDLAGLQVEVVTAAADRPDRPTVLTSAAFERPVTASLAWFPLAGGVRLAWQFRVQAVGAAEYRFVVDAADGTILLCRRLTQLIAGRASVVLRAGADRQDVAFPMPVALLGPPVPADLPAGFPDPWLVDETTSGASTRAIDASTGQTVAGARAGDDVAFTAPGQVNATDQLVVNLFAFCSIMHDALYLVGFREADGNFQRDQLGRGGSGRDAVLARVHPGAVQGTANMGTPADGSSPTMNMGLVTRTGRHTALDPGVVFHEYTHGLTNRLVGGPLDDTSLDAVQSGGMGEGWSDYVACTLLGTTVVGDWVVNRPAGIRRNPYTDDFPDTYAQLGTAQYSEVHDIGELWCATLMSLARRLGTWPTLQVVVDALKLTAANPSLLAARDAIVLAAGQFATSRGDDDAARAQFVFSAWEVFARYGMGPAARTSGPTLRGIVADFTAPPRPATSTVSARVTPELPIPDDDPAGIGSSLHLAGTGPIRQLRVEVNISHTYRGDLRVTLVAPDGRQAVLHDRAGGGQPDLRASFDDGTLPALAQLRGAPAGGTWTLLVADLARVDTGVLHTWSLAADVGDPQAAVHLTDAPALSVPAADSAGVTRSLSLDRPGPARSLSLDLDLTHAHAGDLTVVLKGPTGKRVTLHRRGGPEQDRLIGSYGSDTGEPLAGFVGLDGQGPWTLSVVDRAGRDAGKLNRWALTILL